MTLFKLLNNVNGTKAFPVFHHTKCNLLLQQCSWPFYSIGIPCISREWRLFIDSSSKSLKAVLLHNGRKYPSLPPAHSVYLKETYENVKTVLNVLKYDQYNWEVIGDFEVIDFLMGMQEGFTKYPCYHCLWDSRDTKAYYQKQVWPKRE